MSTFAVAAICALLLIAATLIWIGRVHSHTITRQRLTIEKLNGTVTAQMSSLHDLADQVTRKSSAEAERVALQTQLQEQLHEMQATIDAQDQTILSQHAEIARLRQTGGADRPAS
jgi:TolA-binding protein